MSFSFLLGVLACCISAFVTVNRFGFALEGAWCAVDRIYYDSLYGQLKTSEPKWEGFSLVNTTSKNLFSFYEFIKSNTDWENILLKQVSADKTWMIHPNLDIYYLDGDPNTLIENNQLCLTRFTKIINSVKRLFLFDYST